MATQTDRYEVIETLGTGATSRVEKARDTLIGRTVAQKTFLNGFGSRDLEEQFIREAQIVGRLAHPFIVSLYDVGTDASGLPFLIMEYVEGETLEKVLESAPLPLKIAAAWGGDLASALAQAHAAQIIHGDVKPANILVTKDGHVKLGDFGIARYANHISHSGDLRGTPAYLAPEQILDKAQDARSDLFSLGIILYQMATSVRPFDGNSLEAVCAQIISASPAPPSRHNSALPAEFDQIVMRCLAKDPAQRFASAQDLAASLYPLARAKSNPSQPSPAPEAEAVSSPPTYTKMAVGAAAVAMLRWFSQRTAGTTKPSWWNRPVRRRDVWVASAAAGIFLISLVPLARALRNHSSSLSVTNSQTASIATPSAPNTAVAFSAPSESAIPVDSLGQSASTPGANTSPQAADDLPGRGPIKPASPSRSVSHSAASPALLARKTSAAGSVPEGNPNTGAKGASSSKTTTVSTIQQTSLRIDVVSDVVDDTLAVYSDDNLVLTTPLEAAHRGDTLRFSCPIAIGDHVLRVILYHGDKEVVVQKENNSEVRAGASNSMEVRVNRRSKMLVKHQTSLEIVWPSRTLSSVIPNGTELESRAALAPR
ncbi:MAG TPA: protein kinase [Candidatus Acidoferrum sp.]|nr:protein kinase [Candidatus Acidoferrum sp.]